MCKEGKAVSMLIWTKGEGFYDGKDIEYNYAGNFRDNCHLFHQCCSGSHRDALGGRHQCGYGFDIWNPRISGASGALRNWNLQNFVDI